MVKVENKTQFNRVINGVMVKRGVNDLLQKEIIEIEKVVDDPLIQPLFRSGQLVVNKASHQISGSKTVQENEPTTVQIPDVANMNVADATNAINTITDKGVLETLLKSETTSANRKSIVNAINAKLK